MTIMPHLRSVNKGAFLLLREGVISLMSAHNMVKIIKIQELPGGSSPAPIANQGFALDPLEAFKRPTDPMALKTKSTPPPTRFPGSAPV